MDEEDLIIKIDNLEKRVESLEKQISTIAKINQSERVKEYIASAEKASKIARLLDTTVDKKVNDSQMECKTLSSILSGSPIMKKIDTAKEFVVDIELDVETQIKENNDQVNKYNWDKLFEYEKVDDQIIIKKYIGFDDLDVVEIPDKINYLFVTKIGEKAFENCKNIKKVILPKHIVSIGRDAFKGSGLNLIILPNGIKAIGEMAFAWTRLEKIEIPSTLLKISKSMFLNTDLKKVDISDGVKCIEDDAFYGFGDIAKLGGEKYVSIRIPNSVEKICEYNTGIFGKFGSYKIIIFCHAGSKAMRYARRFGIPVKRYEEFDLL